MKYIKRLYFIILIVFINPGILVIDANGSDTGISFPVQSINSPQFWADMSFYRGSAGHTQIELYYSIPSDELKFEEIDNRNIASFIYTLTISTLDDQPIIKKNKKKQLLVNSPEEISDHNTGVIDQLVFDLKPGDYKFTLEFFDEHEESTSNISGTLNVPRFGNSLQLSTPQFASLISKELTQPLFIKGKKVVIPNSSRKYQSKKSYLYLYFEIYNLVAPTDGSDNNFQISYLVSDSKGDSLLFIPEQTITKPGTACIKTQTLNIFGFDPGKYTLQIKVSDIASAATTMQESSFWVYERRQTLAVTEEDIKRYRNQIMYFASDDELRVYDMLRKNEVEAFLINFWRSRDKSPETAQNEYMQDCFSRINYAETTFKGNRSGINSDMGRIFIIYGQPDEIDDYSMSIDGKPYMIWHYFASGSGKQYFVFIDKNVEGIYALVHSSVETEIKNYSWREREL